MKNLGRGYLMLFSISIFLVSCSTETSSDETFLDKVNKIVWTGGSNFKSFQSEPFKLFMVEDGICIEFSEGDNLVRGNNISYIVEQNTIDTLKLGYRVVGDQINHCGTFTYYLDSEENLIRTYKECNASFYLEDRKWSFYQAGKTLDQVCIDLED
jgi:hypothetical protein